MAMSLGAGGGQNADINVTPLIDVLAGVADHLHGDHAADSEGAGSAGTSAATA